MRAAFALPQLMSRTDYANRQAQQLAQPNVIPAAPSSRTEQILTVGAPMVGRCSGRSGCARNSAHLEYGFVARRCEVERVARSPIAALEAATLSLSPPRASLSVAPLAGGAAVFSNRLAKLRWRVEND